MEEGDCTKTMKLNETPVNGYKSKTRTGLRLIKWGLFFNIIGSLLFLSALIYISERVYPNTYYILRDNAYNFNFIFLGLWLLGFVFIFFYCEEFGEKHVYKVYLASIFFIIGIVILLILNTVINQIITDVIPVMDSETFKARGDIYEISKYFLFFFSNLFFSLMWIYLIIELASDRIRKLLWFYFGISVGAYTIGAVISYNYFLEGKNVFHLISGLSIISSSLLIFCYWMAQKRIESQEIIPNPSPMRPPRYFPFNYIFDSLYE